jgi:formate dehydrogenase beta subunit
LAAEGKYGEAIAVVREKLPFPGIVGRACFAMCEAACRRGKLDDPLSIRTLKRVADDNDTGLWREHSKQLPPTGHKAAVIGAGPAGLTVAYYLAKKGHAVTVFDAQPSSGGMARYGIPSYRVPGEVIDREVGEVEKLGVKFQYDTRIENMDDQCSARASRPCSSASAARAATSSASRVTTSTAWSTVRPTCVPRPWAW